MELTRQQYEKIKDSLPLQRGNVRLSNMEVLNAILYVAEQGCKWRGLPGRFGNWHTIYVRMNRITAIKVLRVATQTSALLINISGTSRSNDLKSADSMIL